MFYKYIDDNTKWKEFLNYKIFSLYSFKKEKRLFKNFIENKKYLDICTQIKNGTYSFSIPNKIFINKGNSSKKRVVYKFNCDEVIILKYISYLLYDYDYLFSDNLYSFRKNINMHDAIYRIKNLLNNNCMYAYKVDISNYFNSIDKNILINELENDIDDKNLLNVIKNVLNNDKVVFEDTIFSENKGILAGCPLSAFLANYYLKDLDKYFFDNNISYFRYSDDIIIFSSNKECLYNYSSFIKDFLSKHKLCINQKKEYLYNINDCIEFLGFSFKNDEIDISANSISKAKSRLKRSSRYLRKQVENGSIELEDAIKIMIKKNDKKFYGNKREELSWKYWFFPIITSVNGLKEIDTYYQDCLRYIASGRYNKKNYKILPYSKLKTYGYKSLVHEYYLYKKRKMN